MPGVAPITSGSAGAVIIQATMNLDSRWPIFFLLSLPQCYRLRRPIWPLTCP
jgi:hypothetical protein